MNKSVYFMHLALRAEQGFPPDEQHSLLDTVNAQLEECLALHEVGWPALLAARQRATFRAFSKRYLHLHHVFALPCHVRSISQTFNLTLHV